MKKNMFFALSVSMRLPAMAGRLAALALLPCVFAGCRMYKAAKFMNGGSVRQRAFKTEVPFELRYGLIVLKVTLHGKEHSFVLDTGAPNVISKELAQQPGIKVAGHNNTGDSRGASASLDYAAIDSIGIGGLQFLNTGAAVADLRQSSELACYNVDGFIGANLMRHAVWQFDFVRHIITIASSRDSLAVPAGVASIKFHPATTGTPLIDVQMNGLTDHNVAVDLGSNQDFVSSAQMYGMLTQNGGVPATYCFGYGSSGLYGRGEPDTTRFALLSSMQVGGIAAGPQVVSFVKKGVRTVGTPFFKNYRLIFDWQAGELAMIPVRPYDNTHEQKFSFSYVLKGSQVFVGSVYAADSATAAGAPQMGDQVLEIDGQDYRNCSADGWCALLARRFDTSATTTTVLLRRGGKELTFRANKEELYRQRMHIRPQ